jgi:multidrug resistance protein, MATE family
VASFEFEADDGTPEKLLPVSESVKKFMSLSIPAILSFFLIQI